jgi:uncharacterized protein (TIGR03435 family)
MKPLALIAVVMACQAQSPAFEVASVKLNRSDGGRGGFRPEPGRLTITGMTLKAMVRYAYDVKDMQISGGPAWFDADRWDIAATAGREVGGGERKKMLQALLTDRFQMTIRRETKELPVYALVVAKNGLKMAPGTEGTSEQINMQARAGLLRLTGQSASVANIADALYNRAGRMVIDKTGLEGRFDFKLEWVPDAANLPLVNGSKMEPAADGPSLFTAVQEQLGLKLESTKGPVEILVIERAEKAAEN